MRKMATFQFGDLAAKPAPAKHFNTVLLGCGHRTIFDAPEPMPGDYISCIKCQRGMPVVASDKYPYVVECESCDYLGYYSTARKAVSKIKWHRATTRDTHALSVSYVASAKDIDEESENLLRDYVRELQMTLPLC